jgi:hypothetical protein
MSPDWKLTGLAIGALWRLSPDWIGVTGLDFAGFRGFRHRISVTGFPTGFPDF